MVTSSLFLHHLSDDEAVAFLARMAHAARGLVLVQDLRRSSAGLGLAWLATRLFTRSDVVRSDALRSVRAAFTIEEVGGLVRAAGLGRTRIERRYPFRWLMAWERA